MFKKIIIAALIFTIGIPTFLCGCQEVGLTVFANDGEQLAVISNYNVAEVNTEDNGIKSYLEIVFNEAASILAQMDNCEITEAKRKLVDGRYTVYTNFDKTVYNSIKTAYETEEYKGTDFGCAVTNNAGKLLAVYSGGQSNFSVLPTQPYSSIKPLSVYAPAIENGTATWSKTYKDSPVKKVQTEDALVDWPQNATGEYANKNITVHEAVKQSLNTIAVKCLMDYGVAESINFLKTKLDFPLDTEESLLAQYGEEEILGNLGMGYLRDGVSPVDMAGYYQIFANGGKYYKPTSVAEIKTVGGKSVYKLKLEINQVIEKDTANIMNRLLQEVVSSGGTGIKAKCESVDVGGKTGTGELGNWFVGFTPEYSCSVWHGTQLPNNNSPQIFSKIINGIKDKKLTSFSDTADIERKVYCCKSGKSAKKTCEETAIGYFKSSSKSDFCNLH